MLILIVVGGYHCFLLVLVATHGTSAVRFVSGGGDTVSISVVYKYKYY